MTFRAARRRKREMNKARASPIAWLLRRAAAEAGSVYAPASGWLFHLNNAAPDDATSADDWPRTPNALSKVFAELSEGLASLGVIVFASRAMICGTVHRVWIVESEFNHNRTPKTKPVLLGSQTKPERPSAAHSAKMSALKAETDVKHSDRAGAPQIATKQRRKITVEECRRVHAVEALHVGGARTVETQIGNTNAKRTFAVCDACERHVRFLYQLPSGGKYLCARCQNLTTRKRQQKGTRAEFAEWLTPDRWARMSAKHPALISFYDETGADFRATVEPLDCSKISDEERAELLKFYANDDAIKQAFEGARANWSERFETRAQAVGEQIRADIWKWWKIRNRAR